MTSRDETTAAANALEQKLIALERQRASRTLVVRFRHRTALLAEVPFFRDPAEGDGLLALRNLRNDGIEGTATGQTWQAIIDAIQRGPLTAVADKRLEYDYLSPEYRALTARARVMQHAISQIQRAFREWNNEHWDD